MFENQGLITDVKKRITFGKNPSKARPLRFVSYYKLLVGLGVDSVVTGNFAIYTFIWVWKHNIVFPALTLTQKCHLFLKTDCLIINWHLLSYTTFHTERLSSSDKIWHQRDFKNSNFQTLQGTRKKLEVQPRFFKIPIFYPFYELGKTAQDQHFKIQILYLWMNWEKLCPNLSFIVENKIENSHKKRMESKRLAQWVKVLQSELEDSQFKPLKVLSQAQ